LLAVAAVAVVLLVVAVLVVSVRYQPLYMLELLTQLQ
jgi:hypothetical protein